MQFHLSSLISHFLSEPECGVDFPGVRSSGGKGKVCCVKECGICGGDGCSTIGASLGLGADECCTKEIRAGKKLCSDTETAPCIIEASEFLPSVDAAFNLSRLWRCCCFFSVVLEFNSDGRELPFVECLHCALVMW